jgi:hypothetical protein
LQTFSRHSLFAGSLTVFQFLFANPDSACFFLPDFLTFKIFDHENYKG